MPWRGKSKPSIPSGARRPGVAAGPELEPLSQIIEGLNERFGLNLGREHRLTLEQLRTVLDEDAALDASARVNTRENVRLTFEPKVEERIQEIVETNFEFYKRITDDPEFGQALKDVLFDDYIRRHRRVEELLKLQESKTLEFKSSLRWNLKEDRKDDKHVTQAALKTIAAFLNTEGGDLLIGVADDRTVLGIDHDRLDNDDKFMLHLAQVVRNGLGALAGTCIDPKTQIAEGKTVCLVSCKRSPEPVYLRWKEPREGPERGFLCQERPGDRAANGRRYRKVRPHPIQPEVTQTGPVSRAHGPWPSLFSISTFSVSLLQSVSGLACHRHSRKHRRVFVWPRDTFDFRP